MPQRYTQLNMFGYAHSTAVEAFTLFYFVLILYSKFAENCGIFLLEICFLQALYKGLSQMIKYMYHFLLDNIFIY